jgi:perosamine synthetase
MIPVNEPKLGPKEKEYVLDCLDSGWISSAGKYLEEFENRWAAYCGMKYGVAMCNGTVALEAAAASIDLQPGDEVIMPSFTIISCALAVVERGGIPVLVDCDPDTWCMDVSQVEARITSKTRALMPVHIYGHPVEMGPLLALAEKDHLQIIEDAAEAHGAEYKGRRCGSFGDIACFSFYANKIVTTGEGGMALTNDAALAERLRSQRNLCFQPQRRFYHTELGHNYRMTNIQAAIGLAQVEAIDEHIAHKRWMAKAYTDRLQGIASLRLPVEKSWAKNVYWMYGIVLDEATGLNAEEFSRRLKARGIETRPFFLGMHEQPIFLDEGLFIGEYYPVCERISRQGLYLPSGLTLTEAQVDEVNEAIKNCLM